MQQLGDPPPIPTRLLHAIRVVDGDADRDELLADLTAIVNAVLRALVAAGVVDVKSFHPETPADVAARLRRALEHVSPARLWAVPDCGF